jgi:hypothetical protein
MIERLITPSRWPDWWPVPAAALAAALFICYARRNTPKDAAYPPWLSLPYPVVAHQPMRPASWQILAHGRGGTGVWGSSKPRGPISTSAVPFDLFCTDTDYVTTIERGINDG